MEPYAEVTAAYRAFALDAADSPTFAAWAEAVVGDPEVCRWLETLPGIKQQPNLVFAAARWHGVPAPGPYAGLRQALLSDGDNGPIRATIMARATQTNEVGRLATLLPVLGLLGEAPLALLEVGASAGLCLYPDRWAYQWHTDAGPVLLGPVEPAPVVEPGPVVEPVETLTCRVKGPAPLPRALPSVAWRGGIDLNPLDVTDADQMAWLEQLIWPEHEDRRARLRRAIEVARAEPPQLVRGDLLTELPGLIEQARGHGTVVVFHSAVIAYLRPTDRERFDVLMRGLVADGACRWVSNEGKNVLPSVTASGPEIAPDKATFVLGLDGVAVAHAHGHGRSMRWFG